MWHVNFCSGGIGSYVCGKRVKAGHGTDRLIHLFQDTRSEDPDTYRFLRESCAATGGELVEISHGKTLWELFNEHNYIGNTRNDLCSRIMKRELARSWIEKRWNPNGPGVNNVTLYLGIDHAERHRTASIVRNWAPYRVEFPLCAPPHMTKCEMLKECERDGIDPPQAYDEGWPHNNCNRFCVKAGHAHFLHLLKTRPDVFEENAREEEKFRVRTGKDVAVLRDRRGGKTKPLPMYEFKRQVESGELKVDPRDWGKGCQCFSGPTEEDQ